MKNNIKKFRLFSGITQKEMAKKLNINLGTYRNKEQGRTAFKDTEKVKLHDILSEYSNEATYKNLFFS